MAGLALPPLPAATRAAWSPMQDVSTMRTRLELDLLASLVANALAGRDDLLRRIYKDLPNRHPLAGHCYVAAEALYHLGAREAGYRPETLLWEGFVHWRLRNLASGLLLDPTAAQFYAAPPVDLGRGRGFLTREPSGRARLIICELRP